MLYSIIVGLIAGGFGAFYSLDYGFSGQLIIILGAICGGVIGEVIKSLYNKYFQPEFIIGTTKAMIDYKLFWSILVQPFGAICGTFIALAILSDFIGFINIMLFLMIMFGLTFFILIVANIIIKPSKVAKTTGLFLSLSLIGFIYFQGNDTFLTRSADLSQNQVKLENDFKDNFIGKYELYKEEVTYDLEIIKKGTEYIALYKAEGRMTWENWKCTIKQDGSNLKIYVKEYVEGDTYQKPGDLIFTLKKEGKYYLGKTLFDNKFYKMELKK